MAADHRKNSEKPGIQGAVGIAAKMETTVGCDHQLLENGPAERLSGLGFRTALCRGRVSAQGIGDGVAAPQDSPFMKRSLTVEALLRLGT